MTRPVICICQFCVPVIFIYMYYIRDSVGRHRNSFRWYKLSLQGSVLTVKKCESLTVHVLHSVEESRKEHIQVSVEKTSLAA
jgi:hypothetical protein